MDRIDELRQFALDIANEIGLDAADSLQNEVNLLSQRLGNVRDSIDVLAGIAEARNNNDTACNENIANIKSNLKGMQEVRHFYTKQILSNDSFQFYSRILEFKKKTCVIYFS